MCEKRNPVLTPSETVFCQWKDFTLTRYSQQTLIPMQQKTFLGTI